MVTRNIRWFEGDEGAPLGFHNFSRNCVVCLNYKDYDKLEAGVEPWYLTHKIVCPILINEWGPQGCYAALEQSAQQMVEYAESGPSDLGFSDGEFYGVFCTLTPNPYRTSRSSNVLVGLAYANASIPLVPIQGMQERSYYLDRGNVQWVNSQFAIPLQLEVQLPGESLRVANRVSRYRRDSVI